MKHTIKTLLIIVLFFAVIAFGKAHFGRKVIGKKITASCSLRLRTICNRLYRHAISSKLGSLTTTQWCDSIIPISEKGILTCPGMINRELKCSYAINKNIDKYEFGELPDDLVLFFESNLGWNGVGSKNDVSYGNHSGGLAGIVMVNGEIIHANKEMVDNLRWE